MRRGYDYPCGWLAISGLIQPKFVFSLSLFSASTTINIAVVVRPAACGSVQRHFDNIGWEKEDRSTDSLSV